MLCLFLLYKSFMFSCMNEQFFVGDVKAINYFFCIFRLAYFLCVSLTLRVSADLWFIDIVLTIKFRFMLLYVYLCGCVFICGIMYVHACIYPYIQICTHRRTAHVYVCVCESNYVFVFVCLVMLVYFVLRSCPYMSSPFLFIFLFSLFHI